MKVTDFEILQIDVLFYVSHVWKLEFIVLRI